MQARRLARNEAERIVNELKERKGGTADDAVRFLRDQAKGEKLIELKDVARLRPISREMIIGGPRTPRRFKPYELPADTIAYPPPDLLDQLLSLHSEGEVTLIADKPQMHYYVAVLMERVVPDVRDFIEIYREPVSRMLGDEPTVWQMAVEDKREAFRDKVLAQLRAEAGEVENGELKIPEKFRDRFESSSEPGE
jgi:hypothetical protein